MVVLCILVAMVTVVIIVMIQRKRHNTNSQSKQAQLHSYHLFLDNTRHDEDSDRYSGSALYRKIAMEKNSAYELNEFGAQPDTRHTAAHHPVYANVTF